MTKPDKSKSAVAAVVPKPTEPPAKVVPNTPEKKTELDPLLQQYYADKVSLEARKEQQIAELNGTMGALNYNKGLIENRLAKIAEEKAAVTKAEPAKPTSP